MGQTFVRGRSGRWGRNLLMILVALLTLTTVLDLAWLVQPEAVSPQREGQISGSPGQLAAGIQGFNLSSKVYLPYDAKSLPPPTPTATPIPSPTPISCPSTGTSYSTLPMSAPDTNPPAAVDPDRNLSYRGYVVNPNAYKGLVSYTGGTDSLAPQLNTIFSDNRLPTFTTQYQEYNWGCNNTCREGVDTDWPSEVAGMVTTPGEAIRAPNSGRSIASGYQYFVLYADTTSITLKNTYDDNVVNGYTVHMENVCIDPNLLSLYQTWNSQGRTQLPALNGYQTLGTASGTEVDVAIRDSGDFMDPRSCKDWWQKFPCP